MSAAEQLIARIDELRRALRRADPLALARRVGAEYTPSESGGVFRLRLWERPVEIRFPDFEATDGASGKPLSPFNLALLAYYFTLSDGTPPAGRWIAFSELPDGKFYTQAFQGYSGHELEKAFGADLERFAAAARACGGALLELGDRGFAFQALPQVRLAAVAWLGDEDFPTRYQILFDASAAHHLTADACAILGGSLARRLIGTPSS
jgi:hypothetical protein